MAKFSGFKCDSCGNVFDAVDRTRKVVTFHRPGDLIPDSYEQDLCDSCAPPETDLQETMRPVKKRHRRAETD